MRHYFVKHGAPVWIHVPGTPLSLPGIPDSFEYLPYDGGSLLGRTPQNTQKTASSPGLLAQNDNRRNESKGIAQGLLAEQMLPQPTSPNSKGILGQPSVLDQLPQESAKAEVPLVTTVSSTGA